jgi:hypothetical protein
VKVMVRCKACGFIMQASKLGDKCPACGAPKTAFEPYTNPVGETRARWLGIDLHPVAVHFPTSFAVSILILLIVSVFVTGGAKDLFISTAKIITAVLPVFVVAAILLGLLDGKIRFRKIKNSAILKKKIVYGSTFFIFSLGLGIIIWFSGFDGIFNTVVSLILVAGMVAFSTILGLLGTSIRNAAFPGK